MDRAVGVDLADAKKGLCITPILATSHLPPQARDAHLPVRAFSCFLTTLSTVSAFQNYPLAVEIAEPAEVRNCHYEQVAVRD
jgi:hypothetical protein